MTADDDFPAEEFAAALRAAFARNSEGGAFERALHGGVPRRPDGQLDTVAMVREGRAAVAALEARRRARWERNAAARERGEAAMALAYQRRAAELAEDGGDEYDYGVAAAVWQNRPAPLHIW
jgi:hypothetical protein